ncbi:Arm DNA-binding domain-containing protein [Pseudomonas canadensis]|uniref:Arm DNA-binding domain-containing protein n=1 Tax=Pseudomonas TaxID=286 RepID=UPI0021155637|nr:Arm DNA-binding domain-containing protein [Pseudomonas sp. C 49-2]
MALTDSAARQAKPRVNSYTLRGTGGLALYVDKNGSKAWHFRFTWRHKQQRISLGAYPELSLKEARVLRIRPVHWLRKAVILADSAGMTSLLRKRTPSKPLKSLLTSGTPSKHRACSRRKREAQLNHVVTWIKT